jgi:hypothetical protein
VMPNVAQAEAGGGTDPDEESEANVGAESARVPR